MELKRREFEYNLLVVEREEEVRDFLISLLGGEEVLTKVGRAFVEGDSDAGGIMEEGVEYRGKITFRLGEEEVTRVLHMETAGSVIEARQRLEHNQDLLLLDLALPYHHLEKGRIERGLGLVEEVRGESPSTEIIVMTSSQIPDLAKKAISKGAFYFLEKPVNGDFLKALVGTVISRKESEKISHYDALTGVYTRGLFDLILEKEIESLGKGFTQGGRKGGPLSVIISDVDLFKNYNDTYGHVEGDKALRAVSRAMVDSLRKGDTLARCGGEEFGIILPNTSKLEALKLAERLREAVERVILHPKGVKEARLTISLGVATSSDHPLEELYQKADDALVYFAKKERNKTCGYDHQGRVREAGEILPGG